MKTISEMSISLEPNDAAEVRTFWLSFCDGKRPKGNQFLGVCIVDVTGEDANEMQIDVLLSWLEALRWR